MSTYFGSLLHRITLSNTPQLLWLGGMILAILTLAILHHLWKKDLKKIRLWRMLCLIPLILAGIHVLIYVRGYTSFASDYFPLYIIGIVALFPIPFARRKIGYGVAAWITGVAVVIFSMIFMTMPPNDFNHSRESYTESFHSLVQDLDKYYILKEWKEVDFAELEARYMPMVQEAEQANDPAKFADAVTLFCNELHDGHIQISIEYDGNEYRSTLTPHEYGLAMVQLDNGDVIAVCTTAVVNQLGIMDGTVITKWNGKPVLQALDEDVPNTGLSMQDGDQRITFGMPVQSNIDRIAAIILSGTGGDTIQVSFLDATNVEQTITLSDLGEPHTQREAFAAFFYSPEYGKGDDIDSVIDENFQTYMIDDNCGYLRLSCEQTDNGMYDIMVGYMTGNHEQARELFREKLKGLKSQGMEYLIIDLRNNLGGMDEIACALCELLTEEDYYGTGLGMRWNGEYICQSNHRICGDGEFADLKVVALTNCRCLSAGDGASLYLSKLPNVTLAGITDPCGCNQETGGICVLSDGLIRVGFPIGLVLDENGVPNVDTRADLISRNPVETRIPFDYDAAMSIFSDKEDYELEWAVEYLENGDSGY